MASSPPLPPHRAARVLAVDDTPSNLIAIEAVLETVDVELMFARSGAEALERLAQLEFAVVLLDVQMPGLDGLATLERIRQGPAVDTPTIFVTAHAPNPELTRAAYELGAFDFITKPFDPAVLRAKVKAFVAYYQRGKHVEQKQRALELKDKYLGILAHDLRTPLSVIQLGAQVLAAASDASTARDISARIGRSAKRMEALLHDLLEYARAAAHKMPMRSAPMDLAELCRELLTDFAAVHPEVSFRGQLLDRALGSWDRERLHQALANMLSNAVKYGDGQVELSLEGDDDAVSIAVANGGVPIMRDRLSLIFEPFVQGATPGSGVGLGLSIVREIVRAHGGDVDVDSDVARTRFIVKLPRSTAVE